MDIDLILASQSPRRRQMIAWLDLPFRSASADINENPHVGETPRQMAVRLAREKALHVREMFVDGLILAADTIVDLNALVLGKPASSEQATSMLMDLRANQHQVHTAVSLLAAGDVLPQTIVVTTGVWMRPYTDEDIQAYVASGDPLDKAGAYAIQHTDFHPVQRLNRCYANVVGFPICAVLRLLSSANPGLDINPFHLCEQHFRYRCPGQDEGTQI